MTHPWREGVFGKVLQSVQSSTETRWLVLDGPASDTLPEVIRSCTDDRHHIALPSGERVKLEPDFRHVVEFCFLTSN